MKSKLTTFHARSTLHAWVGLTLACVLTPLSALGQDYTYPSVKYERGQWNKTIPGYRQSTGYVIVPFEYADSFVCDFPSNERVKISFDAWISQGALQSQLDALESAPTKPQTSSELQQVLNAIQAFIQFPGLFFLSGNPAQMSAADIASKWAAGESFEFKRQSCIGSLEILAFARELRRIARAYLGLPPPQN